MQNQTHPEFRRTWVEFISELKALTHLKSVTNFLHWDQAIFMPKGAIKNRGEQIALMSMLSHERFTGVKFRKLFSHFVDIETGTPLPITTEALNKRELKLLREVYRDYKLATSLPGAFVERGKRLEVESVAVWEMAKGKNDFDLFAPYLEKMIQYKREEAGYYPAKATPYEALLDLYEPGIKLDQLQKIFTEIKSFTINLLRQIQRSSYYLQEPQLTTVFEKEKQKEFLGDVLKMFKVDTNHLRLDESAHPFTQNFHPTDVRITTKLHDDNPLDALFSTLHEMGHAFYELGLDQEWYGTPLGESHSMGIHESQSRFWENVIGRSHSFWEFFYPKFTKKFSQQLKHFPLEDCYRMANIVRPSLIRTEADEVTYNLHVLIRFELEREMIDGGFDLKKIKELPELWNHKYQEVLGVCPSHAGQGILQDIHWASGSFGYFPTYTLGNLYCAQFFEQMKKDIPDWQDSIRRGDFAPFLNWGQKHISLYGREKSSVELLQAATHKDFSSIPLMNYLQEKYLELYN